jgi:orotate phosphoribosyltransferase-like protein
MKSKYMNKDIREAIKKKGICHYEVAQELGIYPETFAKWLAMNLTEEKKERIMKAIEAVKV